MRLRPLDWLLYLSMRMIKAMDRRGRDLASFDPLKVRSVLVVSSTGIGDTLMSTPAIRTVRERFPKARIIGHFREEYMELFKNNPHIDGIIPYHGGYKGFFRTIKALRRERFDLALIFHGNGPQAIPMAYLSGAPFVLRLPAGGEYGFLLSNKEDGYNYWEHHAIEGRLRTASLVGCDPGKTEMVLVVEREDEEVIQTYLEGKGVREGALLIGFQAGAASRYKMWPKESFADLGRRLLEIDDRFHIVLTGSPKEKHLCQEIARAIGSRRVLVTAGELKLKHLPALVNRMSLLITNDTGTMHIAIALGVKTVSLFCPTNAWGVGPYQDREKHVVIQKEPTCVSCLAKRCQDSCCMKQITVEEVFKAALSQLGHSPSVPFVTTSPDRPGTPLRVVVFPVNVERRTAEMRKVVMLGQPVHPIPPLKGAAVESWIQEVASRFLRYEGHIVSVAHPSLLGEEYRDGVFYHRIGVGRLYRALFQKATRLDPYPYEKRVAKIVDKIGPDIVHIHNAPGLLGRLRRHLSNGVKVVLHMHNEKEVSEERSIDALVACSRYIADCYRSRLRSLETFHVIPNGVDIQRFRPHWEALGRRREIRQRFGIQEGEKVLLFVGRISPEKGVERLIEPFRLLLEKEKRLKMVIVGEFAEGDPGRNERVAYGLKIRRLLEPFKESVIILGLVSPTKMPSIYPLGDLLVIPSRSETFSVVALEAMASGLPVLASRTGGLPEFIEDGENGLLFKDMDDPDEVASKIRMVLEDPALRDRLSQNGRRTVEERFSWERVAWELERFYDRLLEGSV